MLRIWQQAFKEKMARRNYEINLKNKIFNCFFIFRQIHLQKLAKVSQMKNMQKMRMLKVAKMFFEVIKIRIEKRYYKRIAA